MRIFKICAAKTKYNYYTVNSNIEDVIYVRAFLRVGGVQL